MDVSTIRRLGGLCVQVQAGPAAGDSDAAVATEVSFSDELKELAAESLIQPGHDLTQLGTTAAGKDIVVVGGEGASLILADGRTMLDGPGTSRMHLPPRLPH
jgi:hypothetical protein